ncbi:LacI family DNA-binding transcriptional regulator [Pirellulales bacterium]|nr:LacI family DNA-binding transcriptional regulator [Pirellulales bacterium]
MAKQSDIARLVGVSQSLVSKVLNGRDDVRVTEKIRRQILQSAAELEYRLLRSTGAQGIATAPPIIYLACSETGTNTGDVQWHYVLLRRWQNCGLVDRRPIQFLSVTDETHSIDSVLDLIDTQNIGGLILEGWIPPRLVQELSDRQLTFLIGGVTRYATDPSCRELTHTISFDLNHGIEKLMRWFHQHGARRVALVSRGFSHLFYPMSAEAHRHWSEQLGMQYEPALVQLSDERQDGMEILRRYQLLDVDFDAILFNDADLAQQVFPSLPLFASRSNGMQKLSIAIKDNIDAAVGPLRSTTICGTNSGEYVGCAYRLLTRLMSYTPREKQHALVPQQFQAGDVDCLTAFRRATRGVSS